MGAVGGVGRVGVGGWWVGRSGGWVVFVCLGGRSVGRFGRSGVAGWTDEFKETAADAACMFAREGAKSWCRKFRFPKQKALCFSVYGIETCNMATREWARRGEFYLPMWYDEDMPAIFVYSDAMIESCVPAMEWCEWATAKM